MPSDGVVDRCPIGGAAGVLEATRFQANVARHGLETRVHLEHGDLMQPLDGTFDLVCANLPYVAAGTPLPAEVTAQPATALFAEDGGAALIDRFLVGTPSLLAPGGRVLAEIDPSIVDAVSRSASQSFSGYRVHRDVNGRERHDIRVFGLRRGELTGSQ